VAEARAGVLYADTSALVKLVVREAESEALAEELRSWDEIATSTITSIELTRAVARARDNPDAATTDEWTVLGVLAATAEVPLTDDIKATASTLAPVELRTLDAIHLASALSLGDALAGVLTYDERMQAAATAHGLILLAPVTVEPVEVGGADAE
jgi:predicted nucleic acid-binding protein